MMTDLLFLHTSYLLTLIALSIREILWLRIVLTIAQCGHLTHAYMNLDLNKGPWTIIFVLINFIQILIIFRERREMNIPEQIKDLYENIFNIKTSREFIHFWDQGKLQHIEKETLINAGESQADLMLVLNGKANVIKEKKNIATLGRGQFIAELSYITGKPTSADVISNEGLTYYVWDRKTLNMLRKSKPAIMNKLDRIITLDMAGKLIR